MGRIVVITTGGTIAARPRGHGHASAAPGREVVAAVDIPPAVQVEVLDLCVLDSPLITTAHQLRLLRTIHDLFARPDVEGVVVTHGTDTLEETALLTDLHHHDRRPVVFTGAQRPPGEGGQDGPGNLRDAILTASAVSGVGTLVVFGGRIYPARDTVKSHTLALDAFAHPAGPVGEVRADTVLLHTRPVRPRPLPTPSWTLPRPSLRVDMVMHHCDADPTLLRAAVAEGAQGVVLVATGAGNATPRFAEAVAEATGRGVLVALTTRAPGGPVAELHTDGGAVDLVRSGAVPAGTLRAGQTRAAVLAALLATDEPGERARLLHRATAFPAPLAA
ncbi:asparaginase [Streptomyces sp. CB03911]|uniref:asparaginase n=1 Tax=Streptomyces sp. CB03911 TaxID=1804758 RepID=UPI00093D7DE2|nr:asparaginase [Streptomyces sp. CB03911]OKI12766.1 L-asparaginase [Streptomyces sp. CB03911]